MADPGRAGAGQKHGAELSGEEDVLAVIRQLIADELGAGPHDVRPKVQPAEGRPAAATARDDEPPGDRLHETPASGEPASDRTDLDQDHQEERPAATLHAEDGLEEGHGRFVHDSSPHESSRADAVHFERHEVERSRKADHSSASAAGTSPRPRLVLTPDFRVSEDNEQDANGQDAAKIEDAASEAFPSPSSLSRGAGATPGGDRGIEAGDDASPEGPDSRHASSSEGESPAQIASDDQMAAIPIGAGASVAEPSGPQAAIPADRDAEGCELAGDVIQPGTDAPIGTVESIGETGEGQAPVEADVSGRVHEDAGNGREPEEDAAAATVGEAEVSSPGEAADAGGGGGALEIDEETLREMVAAIVREELIGELGDRITRNVRKLVRREINRILASRELE